MKSTATTTPRKKQQQTTTATKKTGSGFYIKSFIIYDTGLYVVVN
jgi:hypothetical protein